MAPPTKKEKTVKKGAAAPPTKKEKTVKKGAAAPPTKKEKTAKKDAAASKKQSRKKKGKPGLRERLMKQYPLSMLPYMGKKQFAHMKKDQPPAKPKEVVPKRVIQPEVKAALDTLLETGRPIAAKATVSAAAKSRIQIIPALPLSQIQMEQLNKRTRKYWK